MRTSTSTSTAALVALAGLALTACKPVAAGGDVVITTSTSHSAGQHTDYAECGPDPTAETGDYRVAIPTGLADLPTGSPCPVGPAELMPADENPELYAELDRAVHAPAPFEGGDLATCGTWSADDPGDARQMLADCPPLTKGELP